jgi:hypothetical protein
VQEIDDMESWSKSFQQVLIDKIKDKKLESTKPIIVIPTWDTSLNRSMLNDNGPVDKLVKLTTLEYKSFENNIPAWVKSIDYEAMRNHYSVDKMVVLDFFGDKLLFKQNNDYLHGVYGAYLSVKNKSKLELNDNIIYIDLSTSHDQDAMPLAGDFLKAPSLDFRRVIEDLNNKIY